MQSEPCDEGVAGLQATAWSGLRHGTDGRYISLRSTCRAACPVCSSFLPLIKLEPSGSTVLLATVLSRLGNVTHFATC